MKGFLIFDWRYLIVKTEWNRCDASGPINQKSKIKNRK